MANDKNLINNTMQKLPIKLYQAAQARELDRIAIQEFGIPGFELMTRAGVAAFQLMRTHWPQAKTIAVFCGAGNNAGDGYVVAKLALSQGLQVQVISLIDPGRLTGDAFLAYQHYGAAEGLVINYAPNQAISADVIVDALFGTGLDRTVTGHYADAIADINASTAHVLAIDLPSGLHADTGNALGCAVVADQTISFIGLKQGLFTGQAADYCGEISFSSLDIPDSVYAKLNASAERVVKLPMPRRSRGSHKGSFGHVLIVGGEHGYSGAARLAGEAALRVGAGLVSIATRASHAELINLTRPELMCHGIDSAAQLSDLLAKVSVVVIGPGLGQSDWAKSLLAAVLNSALPLVVDADALNLLARQPKFNNNWVITPHPGEAARLLGCSTGEVQQDRFAAVSAMQKKYGGVAVLKGYGTLIASGKDIMVSNTGNPGMASGGMGDVLSGVIAGLLAQGFSQTQAAQQGVYVHGEAADLAVTNLGERGLLAGDLMIHLRKLVNQ